MSSDFTLFQLIICPNDGSCTNQSCARLHPRGRTVSPAALTQARSQTEPDESALTNVSKSVSFHPEVNMAHVGDVMICLEAQKHERMDYDITQLPVLGKGSYGKVLKAVNASDTNKSVAIKVIQSKFLREQTHYCLCIFREMYTLRHLNHPNVIKLLDVRAPKYTRMEVEPSAMRGREFEQLDELHLVFESADCDLHQYMSRRRKCRAHLSMYEMKSLFYQLLVAIKYIHSAHIIHRDIKPDNLLIWEHADIFDPCRSKDDLLLKLSDFGLSRIVKKPEVAESNFGSLSSSLEDSTNLPSTQAEFERVIPPPQLCRDLTKHVVTRWYRAPEVILVQKYGPAVDIWSAGCVLAYLLGHGAPFFPGTPVAPLSVDYKESGAGSSSDEDNQLNVIFRVIGGPSEEDIATIEDEDIALNLKSCQHILSEEPMSERLPCAPAPAIDLLQRMLVFDPNKRLSIDEALNHPFLAEVRDPTSEYNIEQIIMSPHAIEYPATHQYLKRQVLTKIVEEIRVYNRR